MYYVFLTAYQCRLHLLFYSSDEFTTTNTTTTTTTTMSNYTTALAATAMIAARYDPLRCHIKLSSHCYQPTVEIFPIAMLGISPSARAEFVLHNSQAPVGNLEQRFNRELTLEWSLTDAQNKVSLGTIDSNSRSTSLKQALDLT
jgi:hypothetical protein